MMKWITKICCLLMMLMMVLTDLKAGEKVLEEEFVNRQPVNISQSIAERGLLEIKFEFSEVDKPKPLFQEIEFSLVGVKLVGINIAEPVVTVEYNGKTDTLDAPNSSGLLDLTWVYSYTPKEPGVYTFKASLNVLSLGILDDVLTCEQALDVNGLMFVRNHNEPAVNISYPKETSQPSAQKIYFAMELEKEKMFDASNGLQLYWFSLPYSCKISDIFGLEGYNTKWVIQRYRGDKRAELGWQPTIPTFWVNMNQTAVLEANRGYVLALNLTESDFVDVESLRLYFPSETATFMEIPTVPVTSTVPGHECSIAGRELADSHWNIMGIASYYSIDMATNGRDIFLNNEAPNFFYKWLGQTDAYEVTDGTKFVYEPFYSYMVQYAGTINWANVAQAAVHASVSAQRANKVATFCINIAGAGNEDHTFIRLDDSGTKDYVINQDLLKISNGNLTQIYSLEDNYELAANVLPHREQTVMLGVNCPDDAIYTLSLVDVQKGYSVVLYDRLENVYTDLTATSYEFTQMAGCSNDRFEIRFSTELTVPTTVEEVNGVYILQKGWQVSVMGIQDGELLRVYDMNGHCVINESLSGDFSFSVPMAGVYVLEIQGKRQKMVCR